MASSTGRSVVLIAGDPRAEFSPEDLRIRVTRSATKLSELLRSVLQDDEDDDDADMDTAESEAHEEEIPVLEVGRATLAKVAAFMEYHKDDPMKPIPKPITSSNMSDMVSAWDAQFIETLGQEELYGIILAANFLDIPSLLDLGLARFCATIKDKPVESVQEILSIERPPTLEEEREVRQKNPWIWDVGAEALKARRGGNA